MVCQVGLLAASVARQQGIISILLMVSVDKFVGLLWIMLQLKHGLYSEV